jgi:hypothetical protein
MDAVGVLRRHRTGNKRRDLEAGARRRRRAAHGSP